MLQNSKITSDDTEIENNSAIKSKKTDQTIEDHDEKPQTWKEAWRRYPKHVSFIVGNEFCERFSYYGMRSVLLLYLRNYLKWDNDTSTSVYHAFVMMAYFFPLIGAIIADSNWGKYKTILYLSLVYVLGHLIKTLAAVPYIGGHSTHVIMALLGLSFIAIGTGGIKPCVSSFGGDQFTVDQKYIRKQFFSLFYFAINAGSLISVFLTPVFRADVDCYPYETDPIFDECYALAFGVPAALMLISIKTSRLIILFCLTTLVLMLSLSQFGLFLSILFVAGTKWYTIYPPEGSIFIRVCKCIASACSKRWNTPTRERNKNHWLDYADAPRQWKEPCDLRVSSQHCLQHQHEASVGKLAPRLIRDTKYVLRVLVLYIPLPFFWALFDQQGSRWTIQAIHTNGYLGMLLIRPDQVETLNPLFIVILIPLFEVTLYPLLRHFKIPFPPLHRMTTGLILAGLSFVVAAIVEIEINKSATTLPRSTEYGVRFINSASCNITLKPMSYNRITLHPNNASDIFFYESEIKADFSYQDCKGEMIRQKPFRAPKEKVVDMFIRGKPGDVISKLNMITEKTEDGGGRLSFVNFDELQRPLWVLAVPQDRGKEPERPTEVAFENRSEHVDITYGTADIKFYANETLTEDSLVYQMQLYVDVGGVYTVVVEQNKTYAINDVNPNTINVAWLIPQHIIITVGEVFLSITGLEFSYTQAPPSMKSVLTSIWLLTVSLGNVIVVIIAEAKAIEEQSNEFILFAVLIFVAALLFIYLARKYIPVDENEFAQEIEEEKQRMREKARKYSQNSKGFSVSSRAKNEAEVLQLISSESEEENHLSGPQEAEQMLELQTEPDAAV